MKTIFISFTFLLLGVTSSAQVPDTTTYEYCEVVSIAKNMSSVTNLDANIFIDFGSGKVFTPDSPMKDNKGSDLNFTSAVDCLNYLAKKSWRLGQTNIFYQQQGMTARTVTRYTLSRPRYQSK